MERTVFGNPSINWFTQIRLQTIAHQFAKIAFSLEFFIVNIVAKDSRRHITAILNRFLPIIALIYDMVAKRLTLISSAIIPILRFASALKCFQLVSERIWYFRPGFYRLDGVNRHHSKAAFIHFTLFFYHWLNRSSVGLLNSLLFLLLLDLRLMPRINILLFQWLSPNKVHSADEIVSCWILFNIRLVGYIFLLSTL